MNGDFTDIIQGRFLVDFDTAWKACTTGGVLQVGDITGPGPDKCHIT